MIKVSAAHARERERGGEGKRERESPRNSLN